MDENTDGSLSALRLFLSVDITGSTKFKYTDFGKSHWLPIVSSFFWGFQDRMHQCWAKESHRDHEDGLPIEAVGEPELWKSAGDELVFVKRVTQPFEPITAISAFQRALREYGEIIQSRSNHRLHLKGTAWLAGFPNINMAIPLRTHSPPDAQIDDDNEIRVEIDARRLEVPLHQWEFVGPSMDIGFRLSELSTPRKLIVSTELAFLMSDVMGQCDLTDRFNFVFDGGAVLRGILNDIDYPIIWIDTTRGRTPGSVFESLSIRTPRRLSDVGTYCKEFIDSNAPLVLPYILSGEDCVYGVIPDEHKERLKVLAELRERQAEEDAVRFRQILGDSGKGKEIQAELLKQLIEQAERATKSTDQSDSEEPDQED